MGRENLQARPDTQDEDWIKENHDDYPEFWFCGRLTAAEQQQLSDLAEAYTYHQSRNAIKDKYYEGHVTLRDVNLGIALPLGLRGLEVGCSWGQKAVDVLAARSMFDGFVGTGRQSGQPCPAGGG